MTEKRRPRVLIIAEAANPEWVSVPLVGWSVAHALREVADVHLCTQVRNREAILRAGLVEGRDFTAIDTEKVAAPIYRLSEKLRGGAGKGWTTSQVVNMIAYPFFERQIWQKFGPALRAGEYDLVHRVTPLTPTTPSWIAPRLKRAGIPFVMGPLNGGVPWPAAFDAERRSEKEWLSYVRGAYKLLPGRHATLAAASAILTGSRFTQGEIPAQFRDRTFWLPENAIDPQRFSTMASPGRGEGPLRGVFVGRLVPYKGPDMLIEAAMPLLKSGEMVLDIVGDGPMMEALRAQGEAAGLRVASPGDGDMSGAALRLRGWLEHRQVQDALAAADLFTFPSIREFGGGVVLEAMALGLPPLIVDYAGPGELVGPGLGFKVPIGTRAEIVAAFRSELQRLNGARGTLAPTGARARAHVQARFTWEAKARQILQVYDWVLAGGRAPAPQLIPDAAPDDQAGRDQAGQEPEGREPEGRATEAAQ